MNPRGLKRISLVIAICAAVGAVAGIAGSAAAPSSSSKKATAAQQKAKLQMRRQFRMMRHQIKRSMRFRMGMGPAFFGPAGGGPVHSTLVIPNKDGTDFLNITEDSGTLNSVDGTTVHLKEGTDKATYKDDQAIDVGSDAKVIRNGADAKLTDLQQGDHVRVITGGPKGNVVIAADDAFIAAQKKKFEEHGPFGPGGHFGPPPGGPPPGAPGGPPAGAPGGP
jgi:type II secretory pathway pseudopilin PulG